MPEEQKAVEEKAKAQGWNPNYKGENAKSAEQFLKDGETIAPIVAERNNKLMEEVADLKKGMKELSDQQWQVIREAKEEGYKKAMAEIEKKQLEAVEDGDVDKFKALEKEKKTIKKPEEKQPVKEQPKLDPVFVDWHKENTWYKPNSADEVSMAAEAYGQVLAQKRPDLSPNDYYKTIEKHIKRTYPESFQKQTNKLDVSDNTKQGGSSKGYDNLPPEAKKMCDMQVKKFGISKEDWVKNYDGE